jgi:hypothetical protein
MNNDEETAKTIAGLLKLKSSLLRAVAKSTPSAAAAFAQSNAGNAAFYSFKQESAALKPQQETPQKTGSLPFRNLSGRVVPPPEGNHSAAAAAAAAQGSLDLRKRLRNYWTHNDDSQAVFLWGKCGSPTSTKSKTIFYCCICGFPIIPDDEEVFPGEKVGTVDPKWGQGSAEHELYASKGYRYIGLYWRALDDIDKLRQAGLPDGYNENVKNFYRKEMMWSHWYCNNIKSDVSVIKWTDDEKNLEPHLNNIRYIINSVWNGIDRVGDGIESFYKRFIDISGVKVGTHRHLIHYFIHITGGVTDKTVLAWKNNRLCAYITRLNDMIDNLKNCVKAIFPRCNFHEGLRKIIDERKLNPYGKFNSKPLTPWPPPNIVISPTTAPVQANFDECTYQQNITFWHQEPPPTQDSDFSETEQEEVDDSQPPWLAADAKAYTEALAQSLAQEMEKAAGPAEPAGGAGGPRLRKTYGGARRYKQRKTLKKRRKVKRHTRRRT